MRARSKCHKDWDIPKGDRKLKAWLQWYGNSVKKSRAGYDQNLASDSSDSSGDEFDLVNEDSSSDTSDYDSDSDSAFAAFFRPSASSNSSDVPVYPPAPIVPGATEYQTDLSALAAMLEEKYGFVSPGFDLRLFIRMAKIDIADMTNKVRGVESSRAPLLNLLVCSRWRGTIACAPANSSCLLATPPPSCRRACSAPRPLSRRSRGSARRASTPAHNPPPLPHH